LVVVLADGWLTWLGLLDLFYFSFQKKETTAKVNDKRKYFKPSASLMFRGGGCVGVGSGSYVMISHLMCTHVCGQCT